MSADEETEASNFLRISVQHQDRNVLVLTGFGEFDGVCSNPTCTMLNVLEKERDLVPGCTTQIFAVLDVSIFGVEQFCSSIAGVEPSAVRLMVHLGVDSSARTFKLESTCYNKKHFRCPDNQGETPLNEKIDPSKELDEPACTAILDNLQAARDKLAEEGFSVEVSVDPGRFLCNYVYYRSLQECPHRPCVFIHVPTFETIGQEEQLRFVRRALRVLAGEE